MKKLFLFAVICLLVFTGFISYVMYKFEYSNDISINVSDSEDTYRISARYQPRQSARLQRYLSDELHTQVFKERKVINYLVLGEGQRLYVRTSPGRLLLKIDKNENDDQSYYKMKEIAEGIKHRLVEN
jgi:uncharacterized protein (DUF1684 family)